MQSPLSRYVVLAKRWAWMIILGMFICGGGTYIVSKLMHPVYQASALLVLTMGSSNSSPYDSTTASLAALPTYAALITNPVVLDPVVAQYTNLTLDQLNNMLSVQPQSNTQVIELDVKNSDPQLAMQLANDVSRSFKDYVNSQFPANVRILPAQLPTAPVSPRPLPNAVLGALVGLGLAIALIVIFEWIDDRPSRPEEIQELLGTDILINLPRLSRKQYTKPIEEVPVLAEGCRRLCASLNVFQRNNPFKLVMITSALAGEGKSSIASDLAAFLAMTGKRTLLVDTNFHSPALDQHFDIKTPIEVASGLVVTWPEIEDHLNGQPSSVPNLFIVTAGVLDLRVLIGGGAFASASTDLLQSPWVDQLFEHFKKAPFDYVIFDAPPLLSVAETQILASYVHTAVLVVDASKTPRKALMQAKRALNRTHTRVLGVVLNKSLRRSRSDSHATGRYWKQPRTYSTSSILSPETPLPGDGHESANGSGDPNMTVTLPRRRNPEDETM